MIIYLKYIYQENTAVSDNYHKKNYFLLKESYCLLKKI